MGRRSKAEVWGVWEASELGAIEKVWPGWGHRQELRAILWVRWTSQGWRHISAVNVDTAHDYLLLHGCAFCPQAMTNGVQKAWDHSEQAIQAPWGTAETMIPISGSASREA